MMRYYVQSEDRLIEVDLAEGSGIMRVRIDGEERLVDLKEVSDPSLFSLVIDNESHEVFVEEQDGEYSVLVSGEQFRLRVQDEWTRRLANIQRKSRVPEGELQIKAPMPGIVLSIEVEAGQVVERGQGLVVLGAMKMENQIKAPRGGTIRSVDCAPNQAVEQGRVLCIIV